MLKKYKKLIIDELVWVLISSVTIFFFGTKDWFRFVLIINIWQLFYFLIIYLQERGMLFNFNNNKTITPAWLYIRNFLLTNIALALPEVTVLLYNYINSEV